MGKRRRRNIQSGITDLNNPTHEKTGESKLTNNQPLSQNLDDCGSGQEVSPTDGVCNFVIDLQSKPRTFFIADLCHLCKDLSADSHSCPKCHMIKYCSKEHRREHWPSHVDICQAIQQLKSQDKVDHILSKFVNSTPKQFRVARYNCLMECQNIVERSLELWEREIFLFPAVCSVCYCPKSELLTTCKECAMISFCSKHIDNMSKHHKDWCSTLRQFRDIIVHELKAAITDVIFPFHHFQNGIELPQTIDDFFKNYDLKVDDYQLIQLTQIATAPLTIMFGGKEALDPPIETRSNFTIHLIGAEIEFELEPVCKWELFFHHLQPSLKTLTLILIGPELDSESSDWRNFVSCSKCKENNKSLNIIIESGLLYHEYKTVQSYVPPDLICIFNPGLSRFTGYDEQDSWSETIAVMFQEKAPVIMTAYTKHEIFSDLKRIQDIVDVNILKSPQRNPYCSKRPYRNFISDESVPVIFKNYYSCVLSLKN